MPPAPASPSRLRRILTPGAHPEHLRVGSLLRRETTGGIALMVAALVAVVWANTPAAASYFALRDARVGPAALHLDLTLGAWAADGLLAVFFFLVGLELKHEIVDGGLRDPRRAVVPVVAAAGGVAVPALIYALLNVGHPETSGGWAIPTATDIAFAVAVLALIGSHLPSALRIFLLTLAVVDDLIAITIIAVAYTADLDLAALALVAAPVAAWALLVQRWPGWFARHRWAPWLILLPLGMVAWTLLHASGVHATLAGVMLGFTVPVRPRPGQGSTGLAGTLEHTVRPLSTGVAVPVFAFFSAGVAVGGPAGLAAALTSPVTLGIIVGLVVGKPLGIVGSTWLLTRLSRASLDPTLRWGDLVGIGVLAGIGFTVSLLVAELSFDPASAHNDAAKVGVLVASLVAALGAAVLLVPRNRRYRAIARTERRDSDADGVPDAFDAALHDPGHS